MKKNQRRGNRRNGEGKGITLKKGSRGKKGGYVKEGSKGLTEKKSGDEKEKLFGTTLKRNVWGETVEGRGRKRRDGVLLAKGAAA